MVRLSAALVEARAEGTPKYVWLKRVVLDHIERNLSVGDALPSERDLAAEFEVSRMTARRVLTDLEAEGRVSRNVGRGTFVSEPAIRLPIKLTSFTDDMTARGLSPTSRTLSFLRSAAHNVNSRGLDLLPKDEVLAITRLRFADGTPMAIERVHLVASLAPFLAPSDLEHNSLYAYLANRSIVFDGGEETIRARNASDDEARLLQIPPNAAVLHLNRASTYRGRVVENTVSCYRADRYELTSTL